MMFMKFKIGDRVRIKNYPFDDPDGSPYNLNGKIGIICESEDTSKDYPYDVKIPKIGMRLLYESEVEAIHKPREQLLLFEL